MTTDQPAPGDVDRETSSPLEPVPMEAVPPPERRTRAGRNLPAAIAVGIALAALVLASLYTEKVAFVALVVLAVSLALWELTNAFHAGGIRLPVVPLVVGAWAIIISAYAGGAEAMLVGLMLTVLATMLWRLPESPHGYVRDVAAGVFATMYVPFLAAFAALLVRADDGADRVVVFVLLTVLSDVGGYATGVFLGRHPMAPRVSPKKSWEGFAGSAVFSAVGGAVAMPLLLGGPAWAGAVTGLAVMTAATLGDLGESMIKRDLDIKDMGSLLPGHGGLMDRLDSLLLGAPVAYLLLGWLTPVPGA
jgi:phosphatidate cytidylyltransferase